MSLLLVVLLVLLGIDLERHRRASTTRSALAVRAVRSRSALLSGGVVGVLVAAGNGLVVASSDNGGGGGAVLGTTVIAVLVGLVVMLLVTARPTASRTRTVTRPR